MIRLVVAYRLRPRRRHYGGIICFRYQVLGRTYYAPTCQDFWINTNYQMQTSCKFRHRQECLCYKKNIKQIVFFIFAYLVMFYFFCVKGFIRQVYCKRLYQQQLFEIAITQMFYLSYLSYLSYIAHFLSNSYKSKSNTQAEPFFLHVSHRKIDLMGDFQRTLSRQILFQQFRFSMNPF